MNNLIETEFTATLVEKELIDILDLLQNWNEISKEPTINHISLHAGLGSIAALFVDVHTIKPNLLAKSKVKAYIDKLAELLADSEILYSSFCGGLSGYAYLLRYLKSLNDPELYHPEFDDYLEEIDEVVAEKLIEDLEKDHMDILHGALGIGIYMIQGGHHNFVEKIIEKLDHLAVRKDGMVFWKHYDYFRAKEDVYDFGLAHGNAGKLYFLGQCLHHNILPEKCREMIRGCLNFYFNNVQVIPGEVSVFFPPSLLAKEFDEVGSDYENRFSRVAWCYGDLGIFHTFLILSGILKDDDLYQKSVDALSQVALRRTEETSGCNEAGFCHGSAGNSLIFRNIYNITGVKLFEETADYWLNDMIRFKNLDLSPEESVLGYQFLITKDSGWGKNFALLEGLAGVAASCLMAVSGKKGIPLIEEILFLKY